MDNYLIYFQLYAACWMFTEFEPIQNWINNIFTKKLPDNVYNNILFILLGCFKCLTYWAVFLITWNIWAAIGLSMLAQIHKKLID